MTRKRIVKVPGRHERFIKVIVLTHAEVQLFLDAASSRSVRAMATLLPATVLADFGHFETFSQCKYKAVLERLVNSSPCSRFPEARCATNQSSLSLRR